MEIKLIPVIFQSAETLGFPNDFTNLQLSPSPGSSRRGGGGVTGGVTRVTEGVAEDKGHNGLTLRSNNAPVSRRLSSINDREIINV